MCENISHAPHPLTFLIFRFGQYPKRKRRKPPRIRRSKGSPLKKLVYQWTIDQKRTYRPLKKIIQERR